jgi:hypothetical protein
MLAAVLIAALILVSVSYMAMKILTTVVVTPPTPTRELADQPREILKLPGESIIQLQVSPAGDRLALIANNEAASGARLSVYKLGGTPVLLMSRDIKGYRLGWLPGDPAALVYEDAGDIWKLDAPDWEPVNLTGGSSDLDTEPLPSPDGRYILWKKTQIEEGGRVNLWYMRSDGSDARKIGGAREVVNWDPDSTSLATFQRATNSATTRPNQYYLELITLAQDASDFFADSSGETRYIDWLDETTLVYVAMYITSDMSEARGVVYRIGLEPEAGEMGIGTLRSLNDPNRPYSFYLSRERNRLAYQGDAGLEFFDLQEERVCRETLAPSFTALDWMPGGDELVFARGDIIYIMKIDIGNIAP